MVFGTSFGELLFLRFIWLGRNGKVFNQEISGQLPNLRLLFANTPLGSWLFKVG